MQIQHLDNSLWSLLCLLNKLVLSKCYKKVAIKRESPEPIYNIKNQSLVSTKYIWNTKKKPMWVLILTANEISED